MPDARMRKPNLPDGVQLMMGVWAGCMALSILQTPTIMQQEVYAFLRNFSRFDMVLPAALVIYAAASLIFLFSGPQWVRAALAIISVFVWTSLGSAQIAGGWVYGHFWSVAGSFEVAAGIIYFWCVWQLGGGHA